MSIHSTGLGKDEPLVVSTRQAARLLNVGKTTLHKWLNEGRLDSVKIGRARRITVKSIRKLIGDKVA